MSRPRSLLVSMAVAVALAPIATAIATTTPTPTPNLLTVGGPATSRPIPPGFLGLSLEYFAVPAYAGTDASAPDPVFVQLVRNLAGPNPPELRIGGDTTDQAWWPVPGLKRPAGVSYALTPAWIAIARALATTTGARLTLGVNLEADSGKVAHTEANELIDGIGPKTIEALELGNEPELYGTFDWGRSGKPGRPRTYDFAAFSGDFTRVAKALPRVPLAGPADGGVTWFADVGQFLAEHRDVKVTTLHRYPLQLCYVHKNAPDYPTISNLLSPLSTQGLADSVAAAVRASHARGVPLRIDEMNTIGCGSDRAVGESFASALWALDSLFDMARVGVDGVNIATYPGATFELFEFRHAAGQWQATVEPEYYGLDMFAQAAPAGSRLLKVSAAPNGDVHMYATRAPDGTVRVVAINETATTRVVRVRVRGASTTGSLILLTAPSLRAMSGVTFGGQSVSATTGELTGTQNIDRVAPTRGVYAVGVPPDSAAMLTIPPG